MSDLKELREKLFQRQTELHKTLNIGLGETAAPGYQKRCATADPQRLMLCEEYFKQLAPEYNAFAAAVSEELAAKVPFERGVPVTEKELWFWGGPTPQWGGSPDPDTLVKNASYFGAENGIYVYGPTTDEMISRHRSMKKLMGMVTSTCRAPGQQPETDEECAEKLSLLSLKYPNITGGMMDDMTSQLQEISAAKVDQVAAVNKALKKHNPALELFGVVYNHELGKKDFSQLHPYLDGVNLWFWEQEELLDIMPRVELCRRNFPGKKILMGIFIHDYGTADAGTVPELLLHQLKGARQLLAEKKINGIVILGDRELLKWPEQAAVIKGFLAAR